jgi:hypothetical protein
MGESNQKDGLNSLLVMDEAGEGAANNTLDVSHLVGDVSIIGQKIVQPEIQKPK